MYLSSASTSALGYSNCIPELTVGQAKPDLGPDSETGASPGVVWVCELTLPREGFSVPYKAQDSKALVEAV